MYATDTYATLKHPTVFERDVTYELATNGRTIVSITFDGITDEDDDDGCIVAVWHHYTVVHKAVD
jgi:hypothetical protein